MGDHCSRWDVTFRRRAIILETAAVCDCLLQSSIRKEPVIRYDDED
jgi:hypothetical protein